MLTREWFISYVDPMKDLGRKEIPPVRCAFLSYFLFCSAQEYKNI